MWKEIRNNNDICDFMEKVSYFHDSCITEIKYISGAFVNADLSMHPINSQRTLNIVLQRQFQEIPVIELQFQDLQFLQLYPLDSDYTCEITEASLALKDGKIYWSDYGDFSETNLKQSSGVLICSKKLFWRPIANGLGKKDFEIAQNSKTGDGSVSCS